MLDGYLLSVVVFAAVLGFLIWRDRKHIECQYGVLLMRRTKRFGQLIERTAALSRPGWKLLSTLAILICFGSMAYGLFFITATHAPLYIVVPSPSATGFVAGPVLGFPFWLWIVAVAIIMIPHEFLHGVIARAEKIPLKSVGLLLLLFLPGAFVEPNEAKLKAAPTLSKLRVFAAGSFANFIVAAAVIGLAWAVIWPLAVDPGIKLIDVNSTSPAGVAGLRPGMVVTEAGGKPLVTTYEEYAMHGGNYFYSELGVVRPNQTVTLMADGTDYNVTLGVNPATNRTYMGIIYSPRYRLDSGFFNLFMQVLTTVWIFSFGVGIFNVLPLYPLDGGLMIKALADKYLKKWSNKVVMLATALTVAAIVYGFVWPALLG